MRRLELISSPMPARQMMMPTKAAFGGFSFSVRFESMMTQTGARPVRKVALAIVVFKMDKCQKVRSPAKAMPAKMAGRVKRKLLACWRRLE